MKLLKEEKIEEILAVNWTQFIDITFLRSFVQKMIQKNINKLNIIPMSMPIKGNSVSLSRFYFKNNGYYFWVDFYYLMEKNIVEGTMELYVPFENNDIKMINLIGSLYQSNNI